MFDPLWHNQPRSTILCDYIDQDVMALRVSDAEKLGVAGFMTEWYVWKAQKCRAKLRFNHLARV